MEQLEIDLRSLEVALLEHPDSDCVRSSANLTETTANLTEDVKSCACVRRQFENERRILYRQVRLILYYILLRVLG